MKAIFMSIIMSLFCTLSPAFADFGHVAEVFGANAGYNFYGVNKITGGPCGLRFMQFTMYYNFQKEMVRANTEEKLKAAGAESILAYGFKKKNLFKELIAKSNTSADLIIKYQFEHRSILSLTRILDGHVVDLCEIRAGDFN